MVNKKLLALLCGGMIVLAACGSSGTKDTADTKADDTAKEETAAEDTSEKDASTKEETAEVPAYEYSDKDSYLHEVYSYLIREKAKEYEKAAVSIPVVRVVAEDDSNPEDIVVYGDFFLYNYAVKGDTLLCVSGGDYPGVMHLKKTDKGYEVTSFEVVEDGEGWTASAKKIFGKNYEDFIKLMEDEKAEKELRTQLIADYVLNNNLKIKQYQDQGWEPIVLADADGYNGPADFLQEQSGKTEFKDFDDVIANLKKDQGYAKVHLYGCDVDFLAVADTVFLADKSAPEASIYMDIGEGAKQCTLVSGNGSSFPLRYEDGIIYGGDNHSYISYFATENEDTVGIMVKDYVSDGDATGEYSGFLREDNSYEDTKDFTGGKKEFDKMIEERDKKPVLEFTIVK